MDKRREGAEKGEEGGGEFLMTDGKAMDREFLALITGAAVIDQQLFLS